MMVKYNTHFRKRRCANRESIQLLQKGGYQGYYSFEWEKLWHPEIEEPEIALAEYPAEILKYFS